MGAVGPVVGYERREFVCLEGLGRESRGRLL